VTRGNRAVGSTGRKTAVGETARPYRAGVGSLRETVTRLSAGSKGLFIINFVV